MNRRMGARPSFWKRYHPRKRPQEWFWVLFVIVYLVLLVGGCINSERCGNALSFFR